MTNFRYCPECGDPTAPAAKRCKCGWERPGVGGRDSDHLRCEFESNGERCRMAATMVTGRGGLCVWHWQTKHDPRMAHVTLEDMRVYPEHYVRKDWRDKLVEERQGDSLAAISSYQEKHPRDWQRKLLVAMRQRLKEVGGKS